MSEMVERVAVAMEAAALEHGAKVKSETAAHEFTRVMARAAIEAMREPTEGMVMAAHKHHEGEAYLPYSLFTAMIDAALHGDRV